MSQAKPKIPLFPTEQRLLKPCHRRVTEAFKRDTVRLVTHEGYSFQAAAVAVGVSSNSLRQWHKKLTPTAMPCGPDASFEQLREENRRLRGQLKQAELERAIFKKVTVCFAKESL